MRCCRRRSTLFSTVHRCESEVLVRSQNDGKNLNFRSFRMPHLRYTLSLQQDEEEIRLGGNLMGSNLPWPKLDKGRPSTQLLFAGRSVLDKQALEYTSYRIQRKG